MSFNSASTCSECRGVFSEELPLASLDKHAQRLRTHAFVTGIKEIKHMYDSGELRNTIKVIKCTLPSSGRECALLGLWPAAPWAAAQLEGWLGEARVELSPSLARHAIYNALSAVA